MEGGIGEEESWERNHGGGIMEEESRRRNHGRGVMGKESRTRNHGRVILEEESWDICEAFGRRLRGIHIVVLRRGICDTSGVRGE